MKPTFLEKALAFVIVALGTAAGIFLSMRLMTGVLGACK
jgi:hypothetical protein